MSKRALNAAAIFALVSAPLFAQNFSYANFSATADLTLNGSAARSSHLLSGDRSGLSMYRGIPIR